MAVRTVRDEVFQAFGVEPDWEHFARVVADRRDALGLTQEQVAGLGGPSTGTMRLIEAGGRTNYRSASLIALDKVLGWAPTSHRAVLAGQEPSEVRRTAPEVVVHGGQDRPVYDRRDETALRDAIRELVRGLELAARGIDSARQAAVAIARELDADPE